MSLSYRQELQHLRRIEAGLRRSDPHLGGMLGVFGRLYAGEGMPAGEQVSSGRGRSRPAAWAAGVLTAVVAAVITLLTAACARLTATCRARTRTRAQAARPERTRHGGEGGDQQGPPGPLAG
jgi:hypothetical protein